jgi:hypothetical protein
VIRICAIVALACALAFGALVASGTMSGAEAKKSGPKICRHVNMNGKVKTWRCKSGQYCCSTEILGYYGCESTPLLCLQL